MDGDFVYKRVVFRTMANFSWENVADMKIIVYLCKQKWSKD